MTTISTVYLNVDEVSEWSVLEVATRGALERKKETPTQMFSCWYCNFFLEYHFEEHLRTAAAGAQGELNVTCWAMFKMF